MSTPTQHNVICHAPGDSCLGCDHYKGKADKCKYADDTLKSTQHPPEVIAAALIIATDSSMSTRYENACLLLWERFGRDADVKLKALEVLADALACAEQRILDDNRAYGCEIRDPSGTIWDHAKALQEQLTSLSAELATWQDSTIRLRDTRNRLLDELYAAKADHMAMSEHCADANQRAEKAEAELKATTKLLSSKMLKADLFDYLAWLEDHRYHDPEIAGCDYLVFASDGTTCWGKTFLEAAQVAEQHDRGLADARQKGEQP